MHQDIIDALNLAQRRRHFAAGGFDGGFPTDANGRPMPSGLPTGLPMPSGLPTGLPMPSGLPTGLPMPSGLPTGLMMPDDRNNPSTRFHKPTQEEMYVGPGPGQSNRLYLDKLYQNELGRGADEGGRDYWLQQLNNGMSMDQVQQAFDQSQEGQTFNQQPPRFSNDPRNPHVDEEPIYGWEPWLGGRGGKNPFPPGTTPDVMNPKYDPYYGNQPLNDVMPDYPVTMVPPGGGMHGPGNMPFPGGGNGTKAGGQGIGGQGPMPKRTPLEELDMMYQSELGRGADDEGRNYWLQQLNNGMSMDQLRNSFDSSQEGQAHNQRMAPMIDGPFGVGGGNGTKAGGSGQPSFPLQNPGYPQSPNAPMPNIPPGGPGSWMQGGGIGGIFNGIGGGNGTKAGGSGTKAGPSGSMTVGRPGAYY